MSSSDLKTLLHLTEDELKLIDRALKALGDLNPEDQKLFNSIKEDMDLGFEQINKRKIPAITDEQIVMIEDELLDAVVNKRPCDLVEGHDEDWFFINENGRVRWNWRNNSLPANAIAQKHGLIHAVINHPNMHLLDDIVDRVKRKSAVKPIKARATTKIDG